MLSTSSGLSEAVNDQRNTKSGRERMAATSFAIPERRAYRIDTLAHARNALARVAQYGSPEEQRRVKAAVRRKYPSIDVDGASSS